MGVLVGNIVNTRNAVELFLLKWFMLHYLNFTLIKNFWKMVKRHCTREDRGLLSVCVPLAGRVLQMMVLAAALIGVCAQTSAYVLT